KIVSSTGALALPEVPKKMAVVGGGVIGLELGSVWARLGAEVTVIEFAPQVCSTVDQECIAVLVKYLTKEGMKFMTSTKVTGSKTSGKQIELSFEDMKNSTSGTLKADVVLVATGRKPFTDGLGCDELGIQRDQRG